MSNILIEYLSDVWYVGDWMPHRYNTYNCYLKSFEHRLKQQYPLGKDTFSLDHGENYFLFFRRLGEPFYYVLFDDTIVVGTICYVYRKFYDECVMYLCDLKFDPSIRSKGLMTKLLYRTIPNCLLRTTKFYAISMNEPTEGGHKKNKILSMGQHIGSKYNIDIENGGLLNIYSLDYEQMMFVHDLVVLIKANTCCIKKHHFNYISLKGVKDIVVRDHNSGIEKPMNLLHLQYVDVSNASSDIDSCRYSIPRKDHIHMFCTPSNSELSRDLKRFGVLPSSTATIIHHNMDCFNWELIQTCDI